MLQYILLANRSAASRGVRIVVQACEPSFQFFRRGDTRRTAQRHQIACLPEFPVTGSESQRQSKGGRFQRIVYPGTETSADVSPAAVAVDGRQDPDRIDEQDARCGEVALRSQLRVAQRRAGNTLAELFRSVRDRFRAARR